jgi:DNA-binding NtrC family response regulator
MNEIINYKHSASSLTILIIDDNPQHLLFMTDRLSAEGYRTMTASQGDEALTLIDQKQPSLVLLDIMMPGMSGLEVLQAIHQRAPGTVVIMTTAVDKVSTAVDAIKRGAYDYLVKPIDFDQLNATLKRAKEHIALKQEVAQLRALQSDSLAVEDMVVSSHSMKRVLENAKTLGQADHATVLITGETGTGKEMVARTIHFSSRRFNKPLVIVNCGSIPKELMEAELLGYAKGAFTGATKEGKKGKVELANQGTLFLDEIGELPPPAQTVLLRILDDQPFYPVGSNSEVHVNVRVIAATNQNLEDAIEEGRFREDLFYRLNVALIHVPPLRERPEDIEPLATKFLDEFSQKYGKDFRGYSRETIVLLQAYPWRGNVRELKNAVERAVLYENDSEVRPEHLSFLKTGRPDKGAAVEILGEGFDLEALFKELVLKALEQTQGNQSKAARLLGITLAKLRYRMEKYGIKQS